MQITPATSARLICISTTRTASRTTTTTLMTAGASRDEQHRSETRHPPTITSPERLRCQSVRRADPAPVDDGMESHEALQCPKCPKLFVESLWSLIAHANTSHADEVFPLDFHSLQAMKRIVPRRLVSVVRPAFRPDNQRTDFLNFFVDGSASGASVGVATALERELEDAEVTTRAVTRQRTSEEQSAGPTTSTDRPSTASPTESDHTASTSTTTTTTTTMQCVPMGGNKRVKRQSPYLRSSKKQVCQQCGELFENRCLLTLHMMDHKRKTHPFQCPIAGCFQCYDSRLKFRSHLGRVHRELTLEQVEAVLHSQQPQTRPQAQPASTVESPTSTDAAAPLLRSIKQEIVESA